jgi:hypothetical protein
MEQRLLAGVRELLRPEEGPDGTSVATPADYENAGRAHLLTIFEDTFGLRVTPHASPHRLQGEIERTPLIDSLEWDFRVPVMCSGTPTQQHRSNNLIIFPNKESYMRPLTPARARRLTPTKVSGAIVDTSSDFMAVFEITTVAKWVKTLASRLEQRLTVTLDRALALQPEGHDEGRLGILDVAAVVGVVGTTSCQNSVPNHVTKAATPLLHTMMEAGRFVFVRVPYCGSPPSRSAGGGGGAPQPPSARA